MADRKAWTERMIAQDPELTTVLKTFRALFDAKVERCDHQQPDLCWPLNPKAEKLAPLSTNGVRLPHVKS